MKSDLKFDVLDWYEEIYVLKIRIYGTLSTGRELDDVMTLPEPMLIEEVATLVAKINSGAYRP